VNHTLLRTVCINLCESHIATGCLCVNLCESHIATGCLCVNLCESHIATGCLCVNLCESHIVTGCLCVNLCESAAEFTLCADMLCICQCCSLVTVCFARCEQLGVIPAIVAVVSAMQRIAPQSLTYVHEA